MSEEIQVLISVIAERKELLRSQDEREKAYLNALAALSRENSRLESEVIHLESELCALQSQVAGDSFVGSIDSTDAPLLP